MAKYLDYAGLSLYDELIKQLIKNNKTEVINKINEILGGSDVDASLADIMEIINNLQVELGGKVEKVIESNGNRAEIFNEADGGGAHFISSDGSESFVGVNGDGKDGLMAQIYADVYDTENNKWSGSRINAYNDGIYYQSKESTDAGLDRNDPSLEIAVKGDVDELREIIAEITGADSDSIASISELKEAIDANSSAIAELMGDGENSIDSKIETAVDEAVNNIVNGAPEALDTLREIVEWIGGSEADSVNIAETLAKNAEDIAQNAGDITKNTEDIAKNAEDIASANEAYNVASSRIDALEEFIGVTGSDSDSENLIDRLDSIDARIDAIREEEDSAIEEPDIRALFSDGESEE